MPTQIYNQPIPFRAPSITLGQLQDLKRKWGENRSQVIIRCIERIWRDEVGAQDPLDEGIEKEDDQGESAA